MGILGGREGPDAGQAVEALRNSIGQLASEVRSLKQGVGEGSQTTAEGLAAIEQRIAGSARSGHQVAPHRLRVLRTWNILRLRNAGKDGQPNMQHANLPLSNDQRPGGPTLASCVP